MRFLIVEDEIKLAESLKTLLHAENHTVDLAFEGNEGFEKASTEEYDLIILDVNLPGMDGYHVCQSLRDEGNTTPVLMLTARDTTADKVRGLNAGADDYLVKPFEFEELLARIRALLRRMSVSATPMLAYDSLVLNPQGKTVMRNGQDVHLSAKEFALLEFLLRRQGQVVSKTQLLDHVWGSEIDSLSNVVDVYIGYLRKKIDRAFPNEKTLIKTYKGLGYKLG